MEITDWGSELLHRLKMSVYCGQSRALMASVDQWELGRWLFGWSFIKGLTSSIITNQITKWGIKYVNPSHTILLKTLQTLKSFCVWFSKIFSCFTGTGVEECVGNHESCNITNINQKGSTMYKESFKLKWRYQTCKKLERMLRTVKREERNFSLLSALFRVDKEN